MSDSDEDDKTEEVAEQVDGEITSDGDDMVLTLDEDDETEDSDE
jgi:hypothetical protein